MLLRRTDTMRVVGDELREPVGSGWQEGRLSLQAASVRMTNPDGMNEFWERRQPRRTSWRWQSCSA